MRLPVRKLGSATRARSFVLYGRSGTGKTTMAATFPKPILYLNIRDDGEDSISDVKQIDVLDIDSLKEFEDAYWWLTKNPKAYKTVIIDTVSQLQTMAVNETAKKNKRKGNPGDWGVMTKRDWGDVAARLKEWFMNYRDLAGEGIEVVFIAQDRTFNLTEEEEEDEQSLAPEVGPALSPSVAKALNASVHVIGNTFIRERRFKDDRKKWVNVKEYCLRVGPSSLYVTKVRKPKDIEVPETIVDPDYDALMDIIEGE